MHKGAELNESNQQTTINNLNVSIANLLTVPRADLHKVHPVGWLVGWSSPCRKYLIKPYNAIFLEAQGPRTSKLIFPTNTNSQIHEIRSEIREGDCQEVEQRQPWHKVWVSTCACGVCCNIFIWNECCNSYLVRQEKIEDNYLHMVGLAHTFAAWTEFFDKVNWDKGWNYDHCCTLACIYKNSSSKPTDSLADQEGWWQFALQDPSQVRKWLQSILVADTDQTPWREIASIGPEAGDEATLDLGPDPSLKITSLSGKTERNWHLQRRYSC